LRLALLSAVAGPHGTDATSLSERPAFRRFAGKSVLARQIDCAAHLGCERVLCLAATLGPDLGAAKAHAERAGLRFDVVESLPRLLAQVTADDDVILIEDGVLPDQALLVEALSTRPAVLAFPADPALDLGFERLDATRAWAGALRTRGDSVARIADLPADCDLASSLLRIALQAGARVVELDPAPLADRTWQRRVDRQAAQVTEWRWVTRQVRPAGFAAPGRAIVERIGLRWAHDAAGGRWRRAPHAVALAAGALAALAAFARWPVLGLGALLAGSAGLAMANIFERVEALGAPPRMAGRALRAAALIRDVLVVALVSMQVMTVPGWLGVALPVLLMGLLWLAEAAADKPAHALFSDRIVLLALLIPAAVLGWSTVAVTSLSLAVLAALLWRARTPTTQLTPD
jgi:hypothetical protein